MKMEILKNKYKDENGYIDFDKAIEDGNAKNISLSNALNTNIYDKLTNTLLFFKSSLYSGGVYIPNKEIYESIISRLIKKYATTIEYYPAKINNKLGVVTNHWKDKYIPFRDALTTKYKNFGIFTSEIFDRLQDFAIFHDELTKFMTKEAIIDIQIVPQHYFAGNLDYKPENVAVNNNHSKKINKILHFDYSFNSFSLVEKYLIKNNLEPSLKNIDLALERFWKSYFNITLGMGAKLNFNGYDSKDSFIQDFKTYAKENILFKQNIINSLTLTDQDVKETIREFREVNNIKITQNIESIIRETIEANRKDYTDML